MPRSKETRFVPVPVNPLSAVVAHPPRSSIFDTMKEGFSFGTGSAIAHSMVGSLFPRPQQPQQQVETPCYSQRLMYEKCILMHDEAQVYCHDANASYTACIMKEKS